MPPLLLLQPQIHDPPLRPVPGDGGRAHGGSDAAASAACLGTASASYSTGLGTGGGRGGGGAVADRGSGHARADLNGLHSLIRCVPNSCAKAL